MGSYPWFKPGQFGTAVVLTGLDKDKVDKAATQLEALVRKADMTLIAIWIIQHSPDGTNIRKVYLYGLSP